MFSLPRKVQIAQQVLRRSFVSQFMRTPFRLGRHFLYPWVFALVAGLALSTLYFWQRDKLSAELSLSVVGGVAALFHFLYSQHNSHTDRFVALFRDFNARFDHLNNRLNRIATAPVSEVLGADDLQTLYDYFNLCAEEYLFYDTGYIDEAVWKAWLRGMAYFAGKSDIRRVWESELKQDSYYGFNLGLVDGAV